MHWIQGVADRQSKVAPLLSVNNLAVRFVTASSQASVVKDISFECHAGERFAIVGESGSGKTVTAMAIMRLNTDAHYGGSIQFEGKSLFELADREMRAIRGREIAMVFQEPMTALNPLFSVGEQICEVLELHEGLVRAKAVDRAVELLELTQISDAARRFHSYPHQLSGGQRQRAMIAMALACNPRLLIADEPTTALDVTVQKQIVELLLDLQTRFGMAILLITHDLPLVRRFAQRVAVMQAGRIVEQGATEEIFSHPHDEYTQRLVNSRPQRMVSALPSLALRASPALLQAQDVSCGFSYSAGWFSRKTFDAVKKVQLQLHPGETLGIVGESGSGKTTLGMSLLRLAAGRSSGAISFDGQRVDQLDSDRLRALRKRMQVVFQDPFNSLSPRMTVRSIVSEGLALHQPQQIERDRIAAVVDVLEEVGLSGAMLNRYPHEFSGGQRQRIAIARALVLRPALLLLDEPTSALDVSIQSQVLELLVALQRKYGMSYLFITHDLALIRAIAHRVLVMKDGVIVEQGETEALFDTPVHPYTRELLNATL